MLYEKKNISFENIKAKKEFEDKENEVIPKHETLLEIDEESQERITKEILCEKEAIDDEWDDLGVLDRLDTLRKQYRGELTLSSYDEFFEVDSGITKDRCRTLANRVYQTLVSTDPFFSISPRPMYGGEEQSEDTTHAQEDFLDYAMDERLTFKPTLKKCILDATVTNLCFMKFGIDVKTEKKKKKEKYDSRPKWILQINGNAIIIEDYDEFESVTNKLDSEGIEYIVKYENSGLEAFLNTYPEAEEEMKQYVEDLYTGKDIEIEVEYDEIVRNDPKTEMVKLENFRFRTSCNNYQDLSETKLTVEFKEYSYYDLRKLEKENRFFGIDKLIKDENGEKKKGYKNEKYEILECTYFADLEDTDDVNDEVKCIFWISEEKECMIGSQYFNLDEIPCAYVPIQIREEDNGLLMSSSVAEDITSEDVSTTMILRFMLEAWYFKNTITPITDNQSIINDFLERRWTHGMPIEGKGGEVDFLGNHIAPPDLNGAMALMANNRKIAENKIGISSGLSGDADPVDPNAPASKTIALLQQQKPDLLSYIECIAPAINQCGYNILALYAQLAEEDIPYRVKPSRVVQQGKIFANMTKADLQAKCNIQTQAYIYAVDEAMMKRELLAFYQMIRQEPLFAQNPEAVNKLLRSIGKAWNQQIRNKIDDILPTNEEVRTKTTQRAMQGVAQYIEMALRNAEMTGQEPRFNPQQLIAVMSEYVKDYATPPTKEEMKRREKRNENIITQG